METSRKIDETVYLRREEARRKAKEIRERSTAEAEEILEAAREKLVEPEAREGAITTCEFICEDTLDAREKALEEAFAAREKALEEAFAAREKACEEALAAREEAGTAREGEVRSKLQELQRREEDTALHESRLDLREYELCTERSQLEMLES
jgi:hypothetical protein